MPYPPSLKATPELIRLHFVCRRNNSIWPRNDKTGNFKPLEQLINFVKVDQNRLLFTVHRLIRIILMHWSLHTTLTHHSYNSPWLKLAFYICYCDCYGLLRFCSLFYDCYEVVSMLVTIVKPLGQQSNPSSRWKNFVKVDQNRLLFTVYRLIRIRQHDGCMWIYTMQW